MNVLALYLAGCAFVLAWLVASRLRVVASRKRKGWQR